MDLLLVGQEFVKWLAVILSLIVRQACLTVWKSRAELSWVATVTASEVCQRPETAVMGSLGAPVVLAVEAAVVTPFVFGLADVVAVLGRPVNWLALASIRLMTACALGSMVSAVAGVVCVGCSLLVKAAQYFGTEALAVPGDSMDLWSMSLPKAAGAKLS